MSKKTENTELAALEAELKAAKADARSKTPNPANTLAYRRQLRDQIAALKPTAPESTEAESTEGGLLFTKAGKPKSDPPAED